MRISITYLITVVCSILLLFIGHKIAVNGLFVFQNNTQEIVQAKVQKVIERIEPVNDFFDDEYSDPFLPMQGDKLIFEAKITSGNRKGEVIRAAQNFGGFSWAPQKEVAKGDSIIMININNEWNFNGYLRINKLISLAIIFMIGLLFFGGKKGFNTILALTLTCAAIFTVFLPSILSGKNIYIMSVLICIYTIAVTLLLVVGFNKKSLCSALGGLGGLAVSGIILVIMNRLLVLTGFVDENSRYLVGLPLDNPINLKAIVFAGIIIGAMGAVEDVSTSIASSLWEIKEKAKTISFNALFRSGLTIGRDIMGSMANTLILAYIGSSLSVVLILSVYSGSLLALFNMEMIVIEILQALIGSLGILFTMPLTALFCSIIYFRDKGKSTND
ncbi:MAG: YibE/F family protein [Treponema sp.]|jgi:uncharacterized membrane protein|nr:YibE/F family protein [Treponema sp.]